MKKETINTCYQFLGTTVRVGALTNPETRTAFIRFFRELRKIAMPIIEEIEAASQPPLADASDEVIKQIMSENYEGELPKISEEALLEVLAESKCDYPIMAVLNTFKGFILEDE